LKNSIIILTLLALAGCATRGAGVTVEDGPGFFFGLWHGMVAPIAFIAHIFMSDIAVYASPNNGGWYDFGFLLGIGAFSTGASSAAR
jgi:hypothetical protein